MPPAAPTLVFDGFSRESFEWFEGLEADNSRAWFTAHRESAMNAWLDAYVGAT
jgi:uncharacterized protein (DUF2461 family)